MPNTAASGTRGSAKKLREERLRAGHEARKRLSRQKLGEFEPKKRQFDPIRQLIEADADRLPELLPEKYRRMSLSPFAFFRGAVAIMARDLGGAPHTNLPVQLCGDAHVQNLGSFEAPDGRLVFDINDFDETMTGPWEWDVKRMAASIMLAGLESNHDEDGAVDAIQAFAASYAQTIERLSEEPVLTAARYQIHSIKKAQAVSAALQQSVRARPTDLLKKYTTSTARGAERFKVIANSLRRVTRKERHDVLNALPLYRKSLPPERLHLFDFFRPLDVTFKIVGTGSVGLRDYVVLMEGNGRKDPLFLQLKQEVPSAYASYLKGDPYEHQGVRVVEGQHKLQPISDLLLGWTRIGEHDYLVRQLNDRKGSIDLDQLRGEGLGQLGGIAGELLGRGHARSGDALAIAAYIGGFDKAMEAVVNFGSKYAETTLADYKLFMGAIKDKRLPVAK